jgi:predicted metal-binding membrane protein
MESPEFIPPQEETAKRFAQLRKLFIGLLTTWKTTLLLIFLASYCLHERFWRDPVMRFTYPLLLFALSLPILDYYNFSFIQLLRKRKESLRH